MTVLRRATILGAFASLLLAASANALSLQLDSCDSFGCQGSSISLDVSSDGAGGWDVTLGIDSTNYTGSKTGVVQAGFKAIQDFDGVDLVSATDGAWSPATASGVSSSGLCSGSSNSDFVCTSGYADVQSDLSSSWVFHVAGGTLLPVDDWTIKFQYGDTTPGPNGRYNGNLISAPGSAIPEPSAAVVFGAGLLVAGTRLRRTR